MDSLPSVVTERLRHISPTECLAVSDFQLLVVQAGVGVGDADGVIVALDGTRHVLAVLDERQVHHSAAKRKRQHEESGDGIEYNT